MINNRVTEILDTKEIIFVMSPFRPTGDQGSGCTSLKPSTFCGSWTWPGVLEARGQGERHKHILGNTDSGVTAK